MEVLSQLYYCILTCCVYGLTNCTTLTELCEHCVNGLFKSFILSSLTLNDILLKQYTIFALSETDSSHACFCSLENHSRLKQSDGELLLFLCFLWNEDSICIIMFM